MRRLALLLPLVAAGCAALLSLVEKPKVELRRVDVRGVDFDGLDAVFVIAVDNPNPIGLPVARLDYQLVLDGHELGEGHADQNLAIPAAGSAEVSLPVRVRFADAAATVESVLDKDALPYTMRMRVGFDAPGGVFTVPIEKSGSFPVPRPPRIDIRSAQLGRVDLGGASLDVELGLENPNSYALPPARIEYALSLDGAKLADGAAALGSLPANTTTPVKLAVRVDLLGGGLAVARALESGSGTLALDGTLDVGGHKKPLHLERPLR